ncbi:MAG: hypothetical protein QOI48_2472 [Solirubrobacteraceae bacterium]|jgi:hypothetical protein|nr:hypothetical protein [Solirubrobacteraceae bacterium]
MRMPGFTAQAGLGQSTTAYSGTAAHPAAAPGAQLHLALVAQPPNGFPPTFCQTSGCMALGSCKTRVRCCHGLKGPCNCVTLPCGGPPPF